MALFYLCGGVSIWLRYCDIVNAVLLVLGCGWWMGWEWEVRRKIQDLGAG